MEKAITRGHLTVADSEGVHHFGTRSKGSNDVYLKVVNNEFWIRILLYVPLISLPCLDADNPPGLRILAVSSSYITLYKWRLTVSQSAKHI